MFMRGTDVPEPFSLHVHMRRVESGVDLLSVHAITGIVSLGFGRFHSSIPHNRGEDVLVHAPRVDKHSDSASRHADPTEVYE